MRILPLEELQEGMVLANSIYAQQGDLVPILYENTALTPALIAKMQQAGIHVAPIREELPPLAFTLPTPKPVISADLREDALHDLEEFFTHARGGSDEKHLTNAVHIVKHLDTVVDQLVDSLLGDQNALVNINDLRSYDEYTYHHSLSIAVLTIAIANTMGFSREEVTKAGRCAILHDIGKTAVPIEIIQKPGRLTDKEFDIVKGHSAEGFTYLSQNGIGDDAMWQGVLCHHEKVDGTGYPFGFVGEQIPLISRMISVADVYDALTSNRPYRTPMQPHEAVEYIMAGVSSAFDYDVVMAFLEKLELYPLGSFLELSNGCICAVMDNENALRPVVRLIDTGEVLDLFRDANCRSIVIDRVMSTEELLARVKSA